jgi:hypothetical protein
MIIGIDFDNTIVSYDALFHKVALEEALISSETAATKSAVKQYICNSGKEQEWTRLQGMVYGPRLAEAVPFPGVQSVLRCFRDLGIRLRIISHKTRAPFIGEPYDLHQAARDWLTKHDFFAPDGVGIAPGEAFFEITKEAKILRISETGCTYFIDDLPEILLHPAFPREVKRLLFDPSETLPTMLGVQSMRSWQAIADLLIEGSSWEVAARELASKPFSKLQQLHGGANNQVYQLDGALILKRYFQDLDDPRDRFKTEHSFYTYAKNTAPDFIADPLAWSEDFRLGLFSKVEGVPPRVCEPRHIDAAIAFINRLNNPLNPQDLTLLPPASEACFSLTAHIDAVSRRISRMQEWLISGDFADKLQHLIMKVLPPAFEELRCKLLLGIPQHQCDQELPDHERCISPSDFGLHNCLESESGSLRFIDFEYAGWDDPAKLVCDFFCQPEIPVPIQYFNDFASKIAKAINLASESLFLERCRALLPLYRVKWTCIILNDFAPTGNRRRSFSFKKVPDRSRLEEQIAKAYKMSNLNIF